MLEAITGLFVLNTILTVPSQLYFIQLKEYRIDRLMDFIKFDKGKRQLFGIANVILFILALINLFIFSNQNFFLLILISAVIANICRIANDGFYRFKKTGKSIAIFSIFMAILISYLFLNPDISAANFLYVVSPVLLIGITAIFVPVTKLVKMIYVKKAAKKIRQHQNLKIVGITGSYGKTSTKEFLAEILERKFSVLKTPENINTDIGVAKIILNDLKPEHEIFIAEMGAYKKGEIAKICNMARPDVAVLTAVAKQHLSLFGSLENIKEAKSELLEALPEDGTAIVNGDSTECAEIVNKLNLEAETYGCRNPNVKHKITQIRQKGDMLQFSLDGRKVTANVLGTHQALNISAAVLAAKALGMNDDEISSSYDSLKIPRTVLNLKDGVNGSLILDDSYNSNADGFLAAIDVARSIKTEGKKILITMGIIELGGETENIHKEIGREVNKHFDLVVVTRKEAYKPFQKVIEDEKLKYIEKADTIKAFLEDTIEKYDLILIENRLFESVRNYILKF